MTIISKVLIFTLYLFSMAAFTSMAALTMYHFLALALSLFFAGYYFKKGGVQLSLSQKSLLAYAAIAFISLIVNSKVDRIAIEANSLTRIIASALIPFSLMYFAQLKNKDQHLQRMFVLFVVATSLAHLAGFIALASGFNPIKLKRSSKN